MPWPFGPQVRLLMAAIGPASTAESAFLAWLDEIDIEDHMDGGSFRLLPLAFDRLRALGVEHPLMGRLKGVYRKAWVDTHALFHAAEPALAILAEAGVPTLLLKGAPLALTYYRSHATRPMSDIDLAVPADQAKAAVALLERRGWTARSRFKPHEIPDSHSVEMIGPTGVEVDLHWHPLHETPSADAEAWWWKDARPLRFGETKTLQPRPAVMLLHVVVHGVRPNEEPPIRWIADAATVIRGAGADLDWDDFLAFAGRQKLNCRLHLGLNHLAQEYGVGVPESVLRTLRSRGVSLVERVENLVYLGDYRGEYKPLLWPVADYARFARSQPFGAVLRGFLPYIKRRWRLESARQIPLRALGALGRKLLGTRRSREPGRRETKPILAEASVAAKAADPGPSSSRGPLGWARLRHRTLFDPAGWRYFAGYFKGRGRPLAAVGALGAAQSAILALTLLLVRYAFNVAAPRGDIRSLVLIGLVLVLARLLASVFTLIARRISLEVVKAAVRRMRRDLIATLYALPREALERHDAADLQTRVVQQTERLDNLASTLASSILPALLTGVFLTAALVYLSWWLTLIMAALAPVMWLLVLVGGRPIQREVTAFQSAFDVFSRGVHFVLRQMQLTRARAFEAEEIDRQDAALLRLEETGVRMAMSYAAHAQIQASVTGVAGLILLIAGGVGVAGRIITMGDLLAFYLAAGLLNGALQKITAVIPEVISGGQSLRDLLSLTAESAPAPYQGAEPVAAGGRIVLDDVSFGYGGRPVLEGVRLELPARSNTVVIGANGAGKTTLVNLILGYFRPDAGALFVDGAPYDDIDMRAFRRSIGFVPQKPTFFTGTIAENIAYGSPEVRRADIEAAASRAGAGGFLQRLPKGLDTVIGEGGARLSGGEAQRLAIARALVSGPRLLILDEPTNHLDAEAVGEIMRRLTRDPSRPAVLTISHDPAVISFADVVYRLEARVLRLQSAPVAVETAV